MTCTSLVIAVLFMVAKNRETAETSINNRMDEQTVVQSYNGINLRIQATKWVKLTDRMLDERSQIQESTYYTIPFI